jgi:hypothetical protein
LKGGASRGRTGEVYACDTGPPGDFSVIFTVNS